MKDIFRPIPGQPFLHPQVTVQLDRLKKQIYLALRQRPDSLEETIAQSSTKAKAAAMAVLVSFNQETLSLQRAGRMRDMVDKLTSRLGDGKLEVMAFIEDPTNPRHCQ